MRHLVRHLTLLTQPILWALISAVLSPTAAPAAEPAVLQVAVRREVRAYLEPREFVTLEEEQVWPVKRTAIIVVDMWDDHHCSSAAKRVVEMAPHLNRTLQAARKQGVFIIHSPSNCMDFYQDTPPRRRAQSAALAKSDVKFQWNYFDPKREGPLEDKLEQAGCSCDTEEPCGPSKRVWKRQIELIDIADEDAVSDDGQEVFNLLQSREIDHVIVMGVHTNRCVLGRPFGIRQLVLLNKQVALCRDLTDSYHRDPGHHFEGLDRIIRHVERYWCPTITSQSLTGEPPFRFAGRGPVTKPPRPESQK